MTSVRRHHKLVLLAAATLFACVRLAADQPLTGAGPVDRSVCDTCACAPDNVAPTTVDCTCSKTKVLIIRDKDVPSFASVRNLTLASCGYVSLPSSGLTASKLLTRVTVRDIKHFHYTVGLFPALESLAVEDVGVLVLDGFGPANRTLSRLSLRRVGDVQLASPLVTAAAPLRHVYFSWVNIDEIKTGTLDMAFVPDVHNRMGDGFIIVNSTINLMASGAVIVRSGSIQIVNSTLGDMASGAIVLDDVRDSGGLRLLENRFGTLVSDSVSVVGLDGDDVYVIGNEFGDLPADLRLLKLDRIVQFVNNVVADVDLGPFLFDAATTVRVSGNQFACDCDPRHISVLKFNEVFPGLLPDTDGRLSRLLIDNSCIQPNNATLADYKKLLIDEVVCKGLKKATGNYTQDQPPTPSGDHPVVVSSARHAATVPAVAVAAVAVLSYAAW